MSKIHFSPLKIQRYFPSDNLLAVKIARMCILVEDFYLESKGYLAEEIPDLDQCSSEFRRIYFLRNAFGTAFELKSAIESIRQNTDFKNFLKLQDANEKIRYEGLYDEFNGHHSLLRDIRNEIGGGHVRDRAVKKGLENMDNDAVGLFQIGWPGGETHFKFSHLIANKSLAASILRESNGSQDALADRFQEVTTAMFSGRNLSHLIFKIYLKGMNLVPLP